MTKSKADEEDYWNSSKFKAFTFDDEDDEFSRLKESKQAVNSIRRLVEEDDDEEDVEKISWSGEPVGRKTKGGNFQQFTDSLTDSSLRLYAPELRKPKSEYKDSISDWLVLFQDYISDWSPEETVQRMQHGKAVSLEKFRSLQDKLLLLDFSVSANDGNVITAVLIYLKRTLSKELLFRELQSRQTALRHLICYLRESRDHRLLQELFRALGRTEDVAYKEHLSIADENKRRDFLKSCLGLPFSPEDFSLVQDHYTLLERQIIIEATDRQAERGGKLEIFQKFPRKASILNMPLITTLYYCCFYHYSEAEGTFSSPLNVRQTFKISEKQFFVTALAARAKLKAWSDVDALFTCRNWLGFTKKKSPLSFQRVVDVLQKNSAPTQTYRDLKDRQQLLGYRGKVERGSAEERKIDELLTNQQIRWKN
ncbi:Spermatogenesis-defective protein 39 like [Dissostichus eleginoides]|uniref:Spermatogenesis-defective protein 39 homolog n=1 Tax=Dissostichus eleginoides TaxID=100907 RepID=A0AAD9B0M5_DISEL|nr:Spermatogenesis-defective protein 39 like [Dissostichus eleginoides]